MSALEELRREEGNKSLNHIKEYFELLVNRNDELQGEDSYANMLEMCVDTIDCVVLNVKVFSYITTGQDIFTESKKAIIGTLVELGVIVPNNEIIVNEFLDKIIEHLYTSDDITKEFINDFVIKGTAFINIAKEI